MSFEPDVIIIGSGPAGVSAAYPLLEAGLNVLMLDAGIEEDLPLKKGDTFLKMRRNDLYQRKVFVGDHFSTLNSKGPSSPKYKAPTNNYVFRDYDKRYNIHTNNFIAAGSLSTGGLSNAWGAGVSLFDDIDLSSYPISSKDLELSYQNVIDRIGVSGSNDCMGDFFGIMTNLQSPLKMDLNSELLLSRYKKNNKIAHARGIKLGRIRHALISKPSDEREPCNYCGLCLWGCAYQSVYSSKNDIKNLNKKPNFKYYDKVFVEKLIRKDAVYEIYGSHIERSSKLTFKAKRIMLACGAIGSAKFVLDALGLYNFQTPILSSPMLLFAMFIPERVGRPIPKNGFAMGQLSFRIDDENSQEGYCFGSTFPAGTILPSEFIKRVPLSYPFSRNIIRFIQSSMLLGNCFLSGSYGNHYLSLRPNGELNIKGEYTKELNDSIIQIRKRISKTFALYRMIMLPGSFNLTLPGEDMHYAGTLPMKTKPEKLYETTPKGEVAGLPGIYAIDGASLTCLPAKSHTLTIMANADRIAKELILRINNKKCL